ncbi:hypothetical protein ACN4EG_17130 [Alkalinema pantanalense CENA528]
MSWTDAGFFFLTHFPFQPKVARKSAKATAHKVLKHTPTWQWVIPYDV